MAGDVEAMAQLATRIPVRVRREMKVACVEMEMTVQAFIVAALREALERGRKARAAARERAAG